MPLVELNHLSITRSNLILMASSFHLTKMVRTPLVLEVAMPLQLISILQRSSQITKIWTKYTTCLKNMHKTEEPNSKWVTSKIRWRLFRIVEETVLRSSAKTILCSTTPRIKWIRLTMVLRLTLRKIFSLKFIRFMLVRTYSSLRLRKTRANTCSTSTNNYSSNLKTNNSKTCSSLCNLKSRIHWIRIRRKSSSIRFMTIGSFIIIAINSNNNNKDNSKTSITSRPPLSNRFKVREAKVDKEGSKILTSSRSQEWHLMMS